VAEGEGLGHGAQQHPRRRAANANDEGSALRRPGARDSDVSVDTNDMLVAAVERERVRE
jgi:hypothetical protein